jgi:NADH:ubiquinone oxidoreductase subunit B-like Fe-S oxidoreductase
LIDRPFDKDVNIYIGPESGDPTDPGETTIFMGMCQRHQAVHGGIYLPGCPPHAEEIINGVFQFYKDIERPKYADQTEEAKLGELLKEIMESQGEDNIK